MAAEVGQKAPAFRLRNQDDESVSLGDYARERLIVFFYPKAFTPGCTTEACDFRDTHVPLQRVGFAIVGISPDPVERLAEFRVEYGLPYPLLSDSDHEVAAAFGAWGMKKNYGREYEGLIRSTFVIDAEGTVERAYTNVRAKSHVANLGRELLGRR